MNQSNEQSPQISSDLLDVLYQLMNTTIKIGPYAYTINQWLGYQSIDNEDPDSLKAGFQAAAIASHMQEQLFFLEHMGQYLQTLSLCVNLDSYQDIKFFERKVISESFQLLKIIWTHCFMDGGQFRLNFSHSLIYQNSSGEENAAKEGKKIIDEVQKKITLISQEKALRILNGAPQSVRSHPVLPNSSAKNNSTSIVILVNQVNEVFTHVLPHIVGIEGIRQINHSEKVFQIVFNKWKAQQIVVPPKPWSIEHAMICKKMKIAGNLLYALSNKSDNLQGVYLSSLSQNQENCKKRTSKRFSLSLFSPNQSVDKSMVFQFPETIQFADVETLKNLVLPPTDSEMACYLRITEMIQSLDESVYQELKNLMLTNTIGHVHKDFNWNKKDKFF